MHARAGHDGEPDHAEHDVADEMTVELPADMSGVHSLWFYAQFSVSDTWTAVEIPVRVE